MGGSPHGGDRLQPTREAHRSLFHGSRRDECLNVHWFETIDEAKEMIDAWRVNYNASRPHQALNEMTPAAFAIKCRNLELETGLLTAEG